MIRIIVAEDEYFARKVLLKMLKELNLDLEICGEAETGTEVLALMQDHPVDIVITDIRMPDMDGPELAKEMKSLCDFAFDSPEELERFLFEEK